LRCASSLGSLSLSLSARFSLVASFFLRCVVARRPPVTRGAVQVWLGDSDWREWVAERLARDVPITNELDGPIEIYDIAQSGAAVSSKKGATNSNTAPPLATIAPGGTGVARVALGATLVARSIGRTDEQWRRVVRDHTASTASARDAAAAAAASAHHQCHVSVTHGDESGASFDDQLAELKAQDCLACLSARSGRYLFPSGSSAKTHSWDILTWAPHTAPGTLGVARTARSGHDVHPLGVRQAAADDAVRVRGQRGRATARPLSPARHVRGAA